MSCVELESRHPGLQVVSFTPDELQTLGYENLGLHDLMKGYGFNASDNLLAQAEMEYSLGEEETPKRIYLLVDDKGKAAASLVTELVKPDEGMGIRFWETLHNEYSEVADSLEGENIIYIAGIVVAEEYQGQGLGAKLLQKVLASDHPKIILADTKNPSLVNLFVQHLTEYVTGFGQSILYDLSTDIPLYNVVLLAHLAMIQKKFDEQSVTWESPDILPANIPQVIGYPESIHEAFKPIIQAQIAMGDKQTATLPLIAIRRNYD